MGTKKRHHIVPQMLLRGFAVDPARTRIYQVPTRGSEPPRLVSIRDAAVLKHFYSYEDAGPRGKPGPAHGRRVKAASGSEATIRRRAARSDLGARGTRAPLGPSHGSVRGSCGRRR